ncbi:MAG: T9SS type A sorting domain-containing protein [Candidatus Cloacimonetes bacterium]|nr:T9SS type A sorting domain-containing protein [Candidatus Cloacimonadota bacterium]
MKKSLLILIICLLSISYLYGDIYPAPTNLIVSKGIPDTIQIYWEAPTPPEFGEGFEAGIVPPVGWTADTTNIDSTWQIMDNTDYAHSGSYSACVPWTYKDGTFLGFDSTRIKNGFFDNWSAGIPDFWTPQTGLVIDTLGNSLVRNGFFDYWTAGIPDFWTPKTGLVIDTLGNSIVRNGSFDDWTAGIPDYWLRSDTSLVIDTSLISEGILAISGDSLNNISQTFSVLENSKYKLSFRSKQDSINPFSKYSIEIYDSTNHTSLEKLEMSNFAWQNFEFYVNIPLCNSISIRLFPSDSGDIIKTQWHEVNFEEHLVSSGIMAISCYSQSKYIYQDFSASKYAKYKLSFISKQDSLNPDSRYSIKVYDNTNDKFLFENDTLHNFEWRDYEFDIHTSSCSSIELRLFPSNKGDTIKTYWDDIKFEKYDYDPPNQDEWLISPEYPDTIKLDDELSFWLGTSKMYGINSPVYVLLSNDDGNSWNDTLIVCDGTDREENLWEWKKYIILLNQFVGETIKIAFRYLGGNGEMVCLDDVTIGGQTRDITEFFVVPIKHPETQFTSRAPLNKSSRGSVLTGYKLYRRMYHKDRFHQIPAPETIIPDTVTEFVDTDVCMDTVYIYKIRAIYDNIIPSTNYSNLDTGYVYDDSKPKPPGFLSYSTNWTSGTITLEWKNPYFCYDIEYYYIYDNDSILVKVPYNKDKDDYYLYITKDPSPVEEDEIQLETEIYNLTVSSMDFSGNESVQDTSFNILTAPDISVTAELYSIDIEVSKWAPGETCSISDSIKIYRSTSEEDTTFRFLTDSLTFNLGSGIFTDYAVSTDSTYYYYATLTYDNNVISDKSRIGNATPESNVVNIDSLKISSYTDSSVTFQWVEPVTDSLNYGGIYVYTGTKYTIPIATIYKGTTVYEYVDTQPEILDFTFWPFDLYGTRGGDDVKNTLNNIVLGLHYYKICIDSLKEIENFEEDALDPLWTIDNLGSAEAEWQVSDDGSSQWFDIPDGDGKYAWINDDKLGQYDTTNCYLVMPPVTGLTDSDKVFLMFNSYIETDFNGSAYISLGSGNIFSDKIEITDEYNAWGIDAIRNVINLTSHISFSYIDSFYVAFHYNDNGTWSQGWAIDNVSLLVTTLPRFPFCLRFSDDTEFYLSKIYPNPFKEYINFSFFLSEPAKVSLEIYNIRGQKIAIIANNKEFNKGPKKLLWDGTDYNGKKVGSGIYLYKVVINNKLKVNKLMLIR